LKDVVAFLKTSQGILLGIFRYQDGPGAIRNLPALVHRQ
jgi:hypothetical protein